jgi:hypothetical protein
MKKTTLLIMAVAPALLVFGCVDGDLRRRDDGVAASGVALQRVSPLHEEQMRAEVRRLREENPELSRRDAISQARKNIGPDVTPAATGPTRSELKRRKAEKRFEEEWTQMQRQP